MTRSGSKSPSSKSTWETDERLSWRARRYVPCPHATALTEQHRDAMAVWERQQAAELTKANAAIKAARVQAIRERALARGYHEEDISSISNADPVAVARPLTEKSVSSADGDI